MPASRAPGGPCPAASVGPTWLLLHLLLVEVILVTMPTVAVRAAAILPPAQIPVEYKCKRVLWFHAVGGHELLYHRLLLPAVASAAANSPALEPHLLFDPSHSPQPLPKSLYNLYRAVGGTVHHHNLSIYSKLEEAVGQGQRSDAWLTRSGAFLRLDIPTVFGAIKPTLDPAVYETEWVLYTDIDVLFLGPIDSCTFSKPSILSMGPQNFRHTIANSGVMVLNVDAFAAHKEKMLEHAVAKAWDFPGYDQPLLLSYFEKSAIDLLPDAFNWKGYWGYPRPDEAPITIAHWHGPKPGDNTHCLLCTATRGCGNAVDQCILPPIYKKLFNTAPDLTLYRDMQLLHYFFTNRASDLAESAANDGA